MQLTPNILFAAALIVLSEACFALGINFSAAPDFQKHTISSIIYAPKQYMYLPEAVDHFTYDKLGANSKSQPEEVTASLTVNSDWGSGYCATLVLLNTCNTAISWEIAIPIDGNIRNLWNGKWTQTGSTLKVSGLGWNAILEAGELNTSVGLCVNR